MALFKGMISCVLFISISTTTLLAQTSSTDRPWFIVLPLRFTQLQSTHTMLSGVKVGKAIHNRLNVSASVYHSFYVKSFKAPANIDGFSEQPRLFINCIGGETEYQLFNSNKVSAGMQLLIGWGFMKYDLKEHHFRSKQVNYLALEPIVNLQYRINANTYVGFGVGYRPLFTGKSISYVSDISTGVIPLSKQSPNGWQAVVSLKGML